MSTEELLWIPFFPNICLAWNRPTCTRSLQMVFSAKTSLCFYHEKPRQTLEEVFTKQGVNSSRQEAHNGWGLEVNQNLSYKQPPTWLNVPNLFVIYPTQGLWSVHELQVVKQLKLCSGPLSLVLILCLPLSLTVPPTLLLPTPPISQPLPRKDTFPDVITKS